MLRALGLPRLLYSNFSSFFFACLTSTSSRDLQGSCSPEKGQSSLRGRSGARRERGVPSHLRGEREQSVLGYCSLQLYPYLGLCTERAGYTDPRRCERLIFALESDWLIKAGTFAR